MRDWKETSQTPSEGLDDVSCVDIQPSNSFRLHACRHLHRFSTSLTADQRIASVLPLLQSRELRSERHPMQLGKVLAQTSRLPVQRSFGTHFRLF